MNVIERFTRNHVIDSDDQNVLVQIGNNDTANCFMIGDIVNENWERAIKNGWHVPNKEMWPDDYVTKAFIAASAAYYVGNKSARTVRYYADVSGFFGADVRETFDMLSFFHFAHAKKYEDWQDYLVFAQSGGKDAGIVSVEGCESEWMKRYRNKILENADLPPRIEDQDQVKTENKFSLAGVCAYAINLVNRFASDASIEEGPRNKIAKAITLLNEAIAESKESVLE